MTLLPRPAGRDSTSPARSSRSIAEMTAAIGSPARPASSAAEARLRRRRISHSVIQSELQIASMSPGRSIGIAACDMSGHYRSVSRSLCREACGARAYNVDQSIYKPWQLRFSL